MLKLEPSGLGLRPKNMADKQVLAWWLRQRTAVSRRWISERLRLGEESGVTCAVRTVKGSHEGKLEAIKRRLLNSLEEL